MKERSFNPIAGRDHSTGRESRHGRGGNLSRTSSEGRREVELECEGVRSRGRQGLQLPPLLWPQ